MKTALIGKKKNVYWIDGKDKTKQTMKDAAPAAEMHNPWWRNCAFNELVAVTTSVRAGLLIESE